MRQLGLHLIWRFITRNHITLGLKWTQGKSPLSHMLVSGQPPTGRPHTWSRSRNDIGYPLGNTSASMDCGRCSRLNQSGNGLVSEMFAALELRQRDRPAERKCWRERGFLAAFDCRGDLTPLRMKSLRSALPEIGRDSEPIDSCLSAAYAFQS